jgi:hypothetical protein
MVMKYVAAVLALTLFVIFNGAILVKMKEVPLAIVIFIGVAMMAADLFQSLKSRDE